MAHFAKDGTPFTNLPQAKQHDRKNALRVSIQAGSLPGDRSGDSDSDQDQDKDITQDPHAMKLVDELKSMGYNGDDIAQACGPEDSDMDQDQDSGAKFGSGLKLPSNFGR